MSSDDGATERPYVESNVIMTTVRVVAPFVFAFGLFVMFHGADSPGGGFQGGVIVGSVVLMLAFAFGIDTTREWVSERALVGLAAGGVLTFAAVGLVALALGAAFLEYSVYEQFVPDASKYGIELVELAIGGIVAAVVVALFFMLAAGFNADGEDEEGGESA